MREIVHIQAGQCGNQIGAKVRESLQNIFLNVPSLAIVRRPLAFPSLCYPPPSHQPSFCYFNSSINLFD